MPRRAGLDRAVVVKSAAELINAEGLEALSLGRLAAQLGVQTPSLYNHIDGLPGLQRELALLNARALGDCLGNAAIGKSGAQALVALAQAYRTYIHDKPGVYLSGLRASLNQPVPDVELEQVEERLVNVVLVVMASLGLEGEDALHAVRGLRSVVHGFATLELAGGFGLPLDCDESFRRLLEMLVRGLQNAEDVH
jgi:AcrR family transcriptional regulator